MKQEVRLNNILYSELFEVGGDKLISLYVTLKAVKNRRIKIRAYKSSKGHKIERYGLLRKETNLSLSILKKYLPQLMRMGLCWFDSKNGDFIMLGNNKVNKEYKRKKRRKIVRVRVGNNFKETQLYSYLLRLKTKQLQQEKRAVVKANRKNLVTKFEKGYYLSSDDRARVKRILDKNLPFDNILDKSVLSHAGFAKLKTGEVNYSSKGQYWRTKLVKCGLIKTTIRREFIVEMPYKHFLKFKYSDNSLVYENGKMYKNLPSEFKVISDVIKLPQQDRKVLPKGTPITMDFDFLAWWKQQPPK